MRATVAWVASNSRGGVLMRTRGRRFGIRALYTIARDPPRPVTGEEGAPGTAGLHGDLAGGVAVGVAARASLGPRRLDPCLPPPPQGEGLRFALAACLERPAQRRRQPLPR